ncbi:MAG TPA: CPBP family intramembrane glutamic endopeptidase, partial [Anaerolineae bacterium]|nr:CPBP family intramembrane glutamic endopeptidase [Anaerolineae bacterium]
LIRMGRHGNSHEGRKVVNGNQPATRSPFLFFLLVFLLSVPFLLLLFLGERFLPEMPANLPITAPMVLIPMAAALILVYREGGRQGVKALLKRALDYRKIEPIWLLLIFLLLPLIMVLSYVWLSLAGNAIPDPEVPILLVPVYLFLFAIAGTGEELGWQGYAFDPLEERWNALGAAIVVGVVWQLWHLLPDVQAQQAPGWIFWQRVSSVALRVLIVWVYNNTGKSVFAAIALHAVSNAGVYLFPNYGSHYDPFTTGVLIIIAAAVVVFLWGPRTLARFRFAREGRSRFPDRSVRQ